MEKRPANLLFDLGGVIMDIRRDDAVEALEALGIADAGELLGKYVQRGIFADLESGLISPDEFRGALRRHLSRPATDRELDLAFERFLTGIPRRRLEALRGLRRQFRVFLLSNTNPIMWNDRIDADFRQEGLDINSYFDGIVTSFGARAMKPDAAIFHYAEKKLGIVPADTLFLDDSQSNLDAAAALDYQTALVPPGTEFTDILAGKAITISSAT